jgi:hypothetical protein
MTGITDNLPVRDRIDWFCLAFEGECRLLGILIDISFDIDFVEVSCGYDVNTLIEVSQSFF